MPTRRMTLIGIGQLLAGAGAISSGAFDGATEVSADFRVLVVTDLKLTPGREDDRYVDVDGEGLVEAISLDGSDSDADGINQHARTRFENLVDLTNNGNTTVHELHFEIDVTDVNLQQGDPTPGEIAETLQIVTRNDEIDANGAVDFFTISDDETVDDGELAPGETISFGMQIDLHPGNGPGSIETLPDSDRFDVTLTVQAKTG